MPLFNFSVKRDDVAANTSTANLPNYLSARNELAIFAGDTLKAAGGEFWRERSWTVDLSDERSQWLCSLHIIASEAAGMIVAAARKI